MRYLLAAVAVMCLVLPVTAQNAATLSGFIRDADTGETLILANLVLAETSLGAATNTSGYYVVSGIPAGSYQVLASYIGYETAVLEVTLGAGEERRLNVELIPIGLMVDEVIVSGEREGLEDGRIGVSRMTTATIRSLPTILEPDVFRSLQLLPGVKAASDYSSGLYIRGGSPDQTLILLDHTTVYNPTHVFGFFSTFNPDAVKDVRLYKGGFPAEYGGRIGSVVDVYNKDGNRNRYAGRLSLGILASRAMVEGPHKLGSFMLAVRRSTLEPVLAALRNQDIDGIPSNFYFYDINAKVSLDLGPDDKVSIAGYTGRDDVGIEPLALTTIDLAYGNRTGSVNWTHLFSDQVFSNFTFTASRYSSQPDLTIGGTRISRNNTVNDFSARGDLEYVPNDKLAFKGGFWGGMFTMRLKDLFDGEESLNQRIQAPYLSVYGQQRYRPGSRTEITGGLRASWFGEGNYLRLEPRISIEHRPTADLRLQAAYGRYSQFLTLISNEVFTGLDVWLTTDDGVPPAYGDQFVTGIKSSHWEGWSLEVEAYYRTMRGLFQLDPFLLDAAGLDYSELFHFGKGDASGIEVLVEKTRGGVTGMLGYTLGETNRTFPNLNEGAPYAPKYDRLHDVNAIANFRLGKTWKVTTAFIYATGQAYTEPVSYYRLVDSPVDNVIQTAQISRFQGARLPAYHRLDVGFTKSNRFFGFADYELQLQLLNVYARKNIWFRFFEFNDDGTVEQTTVPQIPVPIPNIAFTLTF
ncbi:MAG: hypothetical protein ACI9W4_000141 [Rhodothermales bacterium]|jgi:hypothetical protein